MTAVKLFANGFFFDSSATAKANLDDVELEDGGSIQETLERSIFWNKESTTGVENKDGEWATKGNITEQGLLLWFFKSILTPQAIEEQMDQGLKSTEMKVMFLSKRKVASGAFRINDDKVRIFAKGGPDFLVPKCTSYQFNASERVSLEDEVTDEHWDQFFKN